MDCSRRVLQARAKGKKSVTEKAVLQERRNALTRRIDAWRKIQHLHMPTAVLADVALPPSTPAASNAATGDAASPEDIPIAADDIEDEDEDGYYAMLDATDSESDEDEDRPVNDTSTADPSPVGNPAVTAEKIVLWLPSQLPSSLRHDDTMQHLVRSEIRLREAQANDALAEIRRLRRILTGISLYKHLTLDGTGSRSSTRILSTYKSFQVKVFRCADRYCAAYRALGVLSPTGPWLQRLKELKREDIRGPGLADDEDRRGEGQREPSWIWLVPGVSPSEQDCDTSGAEFMDGVRVEWARTRARAKRWAEEKLQLQEEMRRVVAFFEWKSRWWLDQRMRREDLPSTLQCGLACYASMQADIFQSLAIKCAGLWLPFLKSQQIVPSWAEGYPLPTNTTVPTSRSAADSSLAETPANDDDDHEDSDSDDTTEDDLDDYDSEYGDGELGRDEGGGSGLAQRQVSVERDFAFELGEDTL